MGVTVNSSTMPGGVTPICNGCGICLCWDVDKDQYEAEKPFWETGFAETATAASR